MREREREKKKKKKKKKKINTYIVCLYIARTQRPKETTTKAIQNILHILKV